MAPLPRREGGRRIQMDSRFRLYSLSFPLFYLAVALVSCAGTQPIREYPTTLRCPDCAILTVTRVVDGDTFVSIIGGVRGRVRLFGVDTPERGMPCFGEASMGFRQLAGRGVRVEPGPRGMDPGGRRLFYVYTLDGNSIDEILIRAGLGRAWTKDGQHRGGLASWETKTRRAGEGCLWNTGTER